MVLMLTAVIYLLPVIGWVAPCGALVGRVGVSLSQTGIVGTWYPRLVAFGLDWKGGPFHALTLWSWPRAGWYWPGIAGLPGIYYVTVPHWLTAATWSAVAILILRLAQRRRAKAGAAFPVAGLSQLDASKPDARGGSDATL
jgi:hypothetical protein